MHIDKERSKLEKAIYCIIDSNYITFWKKANYKDSNKDQWLLGLCRGF